MSPADKHPDTIVQGQDPLNVEAPLGQLRESLITPTESFFIRNHGPIPEVDPAGYSLTVSGLVESPLSLGLEELRERFPRRSLTATIHCAGNRRAELMQVAPIPGETPWGPGAVGTARWAGVSLREALLAAGVRDGARHAAFTGLDEVAVGEGSTHFGGSVPIEKALVPDVLLAYEMNGEPLDARHGAPLRVVVAGYIGARSVKWLSEIELRSEPSDNYFQTREYKLYPPHVTADSADPDGGRMLGDLAVNAVICRPQDGELVSEGPVPVEGYALTGAGRHVEQVEVSADSGRTWVEADLAEGPDRPGSWRFWSATVAPETGEFQLVVRASDSAGEVQPASAREVWNFKGYANNSYHRVNLRRSVRDGA